MPVINLNIAESYVDDWDTWAVAREIICNAKDAGEHKVEEVSSDHLRVTTPTSPSIALLTTIGASRSRSDEDKIGQFGEGAKLAALVATRLGGSLIIHNEEARCTFSLKKVKGLDDRVLHAHTDARRALPLGCTVDIYLPGICRSIRGAFVDRGQVCLPKRGDSLRIYNKGIFVMDLGIPALYDWNLEISEINRDRALVDQDRALVYVGRYLTQSLEDKEVARNIIRNDECFEVKAIDRVFFAQTEQKELFGEVWNELYGDHAVLASENMSFNSIAQAKHYRVIFKNRAFAKFDIMTAADVVELKDELKETQVDGKFYEEANKIMDYLEVGGKVIFFQDEDDAILGKTDGQVVYINERLCGPGRRKERLGTIAHELAHIKSRSIDASVSFEEALSDFCGELLSYFV